MKKISLVKQQELLQHAIQELKALEFIKVENQRYEYFTQNNLGKLSVTPRVDENGLSLFAMFDSPKIASKKVECNPHSGKYNFLFLKTKFEISNALLSYKTI